MPVHHFGIPVGAHYIEMRDFYKAILAPLGYKLMVEMEAHNACGFGVEGGGPDFWLGGGRADGLQKYDGELKNRAAPIHVAFAARDQKHVDEWYEEAIKGGATDNGKPGLRPQYREGYYAAFVLDPVGNNIEVIHMTY